MARDRQRLKSPPLQVRGQSGRLVTPENIGGRVLNYELTRAGTLRAVRGPVEYHPTVYATNAGPLTKPVDVTYGGPLKGVFHCRIGKRDILLAHFDRDPAPGGLGPGIYEHNGWGPRWTPLIANTTLAKYQGVLPRSDGRPDYNTQFTATPNGVVITPQGSRSYFYDGFTVAPLGFEAAPSPPTPVGPRSTRETSVYDLTKWADTANNSGYAHTGTSNHEEFGVNRLGSIRGDALDVDNSVGGKKSNPLGGILEAGEWVAVLQFQDLWGNRSPLSGRSAPVVVSKKDNLTKERKKDEAEHAERLRVQFAWRDLDRGPRHVMSKNLYRTRDLKEAGTNKLFWVPPNATNSALTSATFASRDIEVWPDNIPDAWLLAEAEDFDAVPRFSLSAVAFGRLWVATEGKLQFSQPFFWGTFPKNKAIFPDASGSDITGLYPVAEGLLVFTKDSTFLVTENVDGDGYKAATMSRTIGCVAPDSIKTLPSGMTLWLGREGFYMFDGESIKQASMDIQDDVIARINLGWRKQAVAAVASAMGEYRCWVPVDGSQENNLCVVFDGALWKERDDVFAQAVCTTKDERQVMLALGSVDTGLPSRVNSLWALDHEGLGLNVPVVRESILESTWLHSEESSHKISPKRIRLWFRETENSSVTVEVMRDWRDSPAMTQDDPPPLSPTDDPPPFWDKAIYDDTATDELREQEDALAITYVRRRPHWTEASLHVPSCEVFKVRFRFTGDVEFIGFSHEVLPRDSGGAKLTRGE